MRNRWGIAVGVLLGIAFLAFVLPGWATGGRPFWGQTTVQQQPVATATATAQPAPTVTPATATSGQSSDQSASVATGLGCLPTTRASEMVKSSTSVGQLIQSLNEAFDGSGGSIGEQWNVGPHDLLNPGQGGASLVWTDTLNQPWSILTAGQSVARNVFRVMTQGGWGTYIVFTSVRIPTPGRSARLCQAVDLSRDFPGATPVQ